jgi:hypothetical protein
MTSVTAFNDMLSQFLVELHKTFPDEKNIKKFTTSFEVLKTANPRMAVDTFMKGVSPYADKISSKDDTFLLEEIEKVEFLRELNIKNLWGQMNENTKAATWQYLQTLYMLGTTITSVPAETLSLIESIAKDCADKMQTDGGELDQDAMMKMMSSMFGGMMKK